MECVRKRSGWVDAGVWVPSEFTALMGEEGKSVLSRTALCSRPD